VYFDDDGMAELFDVFARDTDSIYRPWLTEVVPDLSAVPGSRAADLGCGTGRYLDLLAAGHGQVLGVDISDRSLDIARARTTNPLVQLQRRSLLDVTAERDGQFDTVLTVNTVHHLRDHDTVLPHLRSLVAPGGHLARIDLTDPGGWGTLDWQIASAFTDAELSYRHRSRDLNTALDLLRLRLHPAWLTHATTDIPLTRDQFHTAYTATFPGAELTDLNPVITAVHWHNTGTEPGLEPRRGGGVTQWT
jgi:SAM-dependent methyltransferase